MKVKIYSMFRQRRNFICYITTIPCCFWGIILQFLENIVDKKQAISALEKTFKVAKPQILKLDQGCQFTSQQYIDFVKQSGIRQSMDRKSRWADKIIIERWFRSFKYEETYLTQYSNIKEA